MKQEQQSGGTGWGIVMVVAIIAMVCWGFAQAQEPSAQPSLGRDAWRAKTAPGEADSIETVVVEQHQVQVIEWTLREVDYYISIYEARIESAREGIDRMKGIRENILKEAEKVKLKQTGEKDT